MRVLAFLIINHNYHLFVWSPPSGDHLLRQAALCLTLEKQNKGRFVSNCGGWQSALAAPTVIWEFHWIFHGDKGMRSKRLNHEWNWAMYTSDHHLCNSLQPAFAVSNFKISGIKDQVISISQHFEVAIWSAARRIFLGYSWDLTQQILMVHVGLTKRMDFRMDQNLPKTVFGGMNIQKSLLDWCSSGHQGFDPDAYWSFSLEADGSPEMKGGTQKICLGWRLIC